MISRPYYLDWLKRWKDKDVIKVITGMRRCGKSTIMELYQEDLLQSGISDSNIMSINFESFIEEYPLTAKELYDYVVARLGTRGVTYVFLDEIQLVKDFEKIADALFVRDDVDLYITGSNAWFLSGELATYLTGRYVEIKAYPFSFKEYYSALEEMYPSSRGQFLTYPLKYPPFSQEPLPSKEEAFNRYLTRGGLPFAATLTDERDILDYLEGVFNTIIVKDIAKRKPRMDMNSFGATASFLADNISNISSIKRIADSLMQSDNKVSRGAVSDYLDSLLESYLLFKVDRFDLKGKEYLQTLEKYYLGDLGFRFWLLGKSTGDVGRRIENVVFLELCRRYDRVSIGKQGTQEVDFVVSSGDQTHYYQVAQTVLDEQVLDRELAPLRSLGDNYPKTLLTLDTVGTGDMSGIKHQNLIEWLLE